MNFFLRLNVDSLKLKNTATKKTAQRAVLYDKYFF